MGQPRADEALAFGLEIETFGYNLFVAGPSGTGRLRAVRDEVERRAARRSVPDDWVYVHNFADPRRPQAIRLRGGRGAQLAREMDELLANVRRALPGVLESEEYERRQRELLGDLNRRREELAAELRRFGAERSFAIDLTPVGVARRPVLDGEAVTREMFEQLPLERQQAIQKAAAEVDEESAAFLHRVRELEKEALARGREIEREAALFALEPLLAELRSQFADEAEVLAYFEAVQEDMLASIDELRGEEEQPLLMGMRRSDLGRYAVNVLVDNSEMKGAPVVVERNPTLYRLCGRVDYRATFGSMVTDFHEIRAGALHRANGGYLVVYAEDVLTSPFAWSGLKRALTGGEILIENLGEQLSVLPSVGLQPQPIALDVKVILIGSTRLYHLLHALDEEFRDLFKVKAHFSPDMPWDDDSPLYYARAISRWVREAGLRHFDRGAVAAVVENGARLAESQRKLSTGLHEMSSLVSEASFCAGQAEQETVTADDVRLAIERRTHRANAAEERLLELVAEGTLQIDVDGSSVGRVNGLSLIELGDYAFGRPARVSARVAAGRGSVESIEREIELSGPIHSKGVLILSGYLQGTYGDANPLALAATLTFEQSYDEIEGDSASSAELLALLSALADAPLDQGIAVTGSVNQHGDVQAVGGVTSKIEGFFAACRAKGLTGHQGVALPATNVAHLMLSDEVVGAVREGAFHVWAIESIEQAVELLTGLPAAEVHARVEDRLARYAELARDRTALVD
jgi:predicted ATP-dependent protease